MPMAGLSGTKPDTLCKSSQPVPRPRPRINGDLRCQGPHLATLRARRYRRGMNFVTLIHPADLAALRALTRRHGAFAVRVFGSAARGEARPDSDLDLLVEMEPGRTLLDLVAIAQDAEELLHRRVDVVTPEGLSPYLRDRILADAIPL